MCLCFKQTLAWIMGAACSSQQREDGHVLTRSCLQPTAVTQMQTFNSSLSHERNAQPSTHPHTLHTYTHTCHRLPERSPWSFNGRMLLLKKKKKKLLIIHPTVKKSSSNPNNWWKVRSRKIQWYQVKSSMLQTMGLTGDWLWKSRHSTSQTDTLFSGRNLI